MQALNELDKHQVRQSFAAASVSYDGCAELQRLVALELLDRAAIPGSAETVVDVGCGTGFFTRHVLERFGCGRLLALDIAVPMLQAARQNVKVGDVDYVCADAENIPLMQGSVDIMVSNLALQWCTDLAAVFAGFQRSLKPGGRLFFSTFGPATLQELKRAWAGVDRYTHVNEFYSPNRIAQLLQDAGFKVLWAESNRRQSDYASVTELMRELKGIGARNVTAGRNKKPTTRNQLQRMIDGYPRDDGGRIKASYEIIFMAAEK